MRDSETTDEVADVAIVGAGPVGAVAANLCGVYGLSAVAFDREPDVYDLPRAAAVDDEVQRILDHAGVLEALLPATSVHAGAEFVNAEGERIVGVDIPEGILTSNGYPPLRGIHQPGFEAAVRSCLDRYPDVRLLTGHEVLEIDQDATGVSLVVRDIERGRTRKTRARWLIGCDGASSSVRKTCGIAWDSLGYDHEWLVVDVERRRDVALPTYCQQICDPARPVTVVPMPQNMFRWEFELLEGETRDEMERRKRVWSLLAPWLGPEDAHIRRAVVYRFHATIASTFRSRRAFLAGDAAHQTPPFLGQGMCTGIRDVANLIWKVDLANRGVAGEALLDSYSAERRPMAVAMVEHSVNVGKLIDAYADMARGGPEPSPELKRYAYGGGAQLPQLSSGLLAMDGSKWVGRWVPQCSVPGSAGSNTLDRVVGPRWAIVSCREARSSLGEQARRVWESLDGAFVTLPEPKGAMLAALLEGEALVVRPDRHIYAVAPTLADLDAITRRLGIDADLGACAREEAGRRRCLTPGPALPRSQKRRA